MTSTEHPTIAVRRRRRRSRSFGWLDDRVDAAVLWGLPALVVGSVLAVGTVHVPVLVVVSLLALPLGALCLWSEARHGHRVPLAVAVLMGLSLYSVLQAMPLRFSWLEAVAPSSANVWRGARELLGEPVRGSASVSLDPGASLVEALKWLTYASVAAAAVRFGRRHGTAAGPLVVFASALVAATSTLIHGTVGAERLYGLYEPSFTPARWAMSPLLNSNNYAGYLNLGLFCGIGLLVAPRARLPRPAVGIALATLIAVSAISASRAALGALALGLVALIPVLAWLNRRAARTHEPGFWSGPGPVAAVAVSGLFLAVLGGGRDKWNSLVDESLVKLTVIARTLPMIRAHWMLGSGRGSFETVFPAYATGPGNTIYQHAENFVAQWLAEWGVPVAAVGLLLLCYAFRPLRLRAHKSKIAACSLVGVGVLLAQNFFDLALEIPSVCIALAALLGALLGAAADHANGRSRLVRPAAWKGAAALVPALGLILVPLAARAGRTSALKDRGNVHALLLEDGSDKRPASPAFWATVEASVRRHPADPYLALLAATAARHDAKRRPLSWVGWAIERGPTRADAYLMLANILLGYGAQDQALHALALAAARQEQLDRVAKLALRVTTKPNELERAVPPGTAGAMTYVAMARHVDPKSSPALRVELLEHAVTRDHTHAPARVALASALLEAVERDTAPCQTAERERCLTKIGAQLSALSRAPAPDSGAIVLRARWLELQGKTADAYQWLTRHCGDASDPLTCAHDRVALAYELDDAAGAKTSVDEYLQVACSLPHQCARAARWVADLAASRGDWSRALEHYERAAHAASSSAAWLKVAEAANKAGLVTRAMTALRRADIERRREARPAPAR